MNIIPKQEVPTTRQVQPADESFLSSASEEIVLAITGILSYMLGSAMANPMIVYGLIPHDIKTLPEKGEVTEGIILFNGHLYKVNGIPPTILPQPDQHNTAFELFLNNCFIGLDNEPSVTAPSPVKDASLANTINAHYAYNGVLAYGTLPAKDNIFVLGVNSGYDTIAVVPEVMKKIIIAPTEI